MGTSTDQERFELDAKAHRVVAGVLRDRKRLLLCHRSPHRSWYPDVWDLPGGHVESSESLLDTLAREVAEELDVRISTRTCIPVTSITADGVEISVFLIDEWDGTISNAAPSEHDELRWVGADELEHLTLAHQAYLQILKSCLD